MRAVHVCNRHFNGRQPSGLNRLRDESSAGGWLMRGIKIPQQDFVLKMQGGSLCARGDTTVHNSYPILIFGTDISSLNHKAFYHINMALFSCHMQRSHLIEENNSGLEKLVKVIHKC